MHRGKKGLEGGGGGEGRKEGESDDSGVFLNLSQWAHTEKHTTTRDTTNRSYDGRNGEVLDTESMRDDGARR